MSAPTIAEIFRAAARGAHNASLRGGANSDLHFSLTMSYVFNAIADIYEKSGAGSSKESETP